MVIDIFIGDVVGQGDRRLARIGIGFAADRQLAAVQVDPLGVEPDIGVVRKAELAVDRQAAQRRRIDVEDDFRARAIVTFSPAPGTRPSGQPAGSDQRLAAADRPSCACTTADTLTIRNPVRSEASSNERDGLLMVSVPALSA